MSNPDLDVLFDPSLTFSATCIQLSTVPASDKFHLLFRLLDFLSSDYNTTYGNLETWVQARMRAEWCLWEGYSKWDIGLNPFLGHFVEVWEQRYSSGKVRGDTLVVGIILSQQASELAGMTAVQVLENAPDIKSLDSAISIRALQLALLQQQYAPTDPLLASNPLIATPTAELAGLNVGGSDFGSDKVTLGDATSIQGGLSVPPSPMPMSRSSSTNPGARDRDHQIRQMISKGLEKASCTSLANDENITLAELINKNPETALEIFEPSIQSFAGTIEFNPQLFRQTILPLLISSPLREETFSTLTFLPPVLPVLETLSLLLSAQPSLLKDQSSLSSRFVHEFLANAGRQLEALSAQGGKIKSSRQIQMMCLFLTALLRDGRIDIDEYRIEIREFCVNFLWVVEAADLYRQISN